MPKKITKKGTTHVNVRLTPEQLQRIDALVEKGAAPSRTEFVKDAITIKLWVEESRELKVTIKPQP